MNINRIVALLLALCLMLGLCACGSQSNDEISETPEQPVADAPVVETDAPEETVAEETEASGITYTVKVQDEGGNPVVGAMVQVCQGEICLMPSATDEEGVAVFTVAEEAEYEAKFLTLPAGYDYTTEEQSFHFNGGFELTITLKAVA